MTERTCSVDGCNGKHVAKGLCNRHWKQANAERLGARRREHYASDPEFAERERARNRRYHAQHADRVSDQNRRWREANQWRIRSHNAVVDAQRRAPGTIIEFVDLEALLSEHGMVCHICTERIAEPADLEFDHVIALTVGGSHTADNIRPSHATCNRRKGNEPHAPASQRDGLAS